MLGLWDHIEADFQRDYQIDLRQELKRMSWRRFNVLLSGISPWGAVATHFNAYAKKQREEQGESTGEQSFWQFIAMTSKPSEKKKSE